MAKQAPSKPKGNTGSPAQQAPSSLRAAAEPWTPAQQVRGARQPPVAPASSMGIPAQQAPSKPKAWGPPAGLTNKEQNNLNADRLLKEVMNEGLKRSNQRKSRKAKKSRKSRKLTKRNRH